MSPLTALDHPSRPHHAQAPTKCRVTRILTMTLRRALRRGLTHLGPRPWAVEASIGRMAVDEPPPIPNLVYRAPALGAGDVDRCLIVGRLQVLRGEYPAVEVAVVHAVNSHRGSLLLCWAGAR